MKSAGHERERIGVIIVDHGSVRAEANDQLLRFVELLRSEGPYPIVEPAHMELAEPTLAAAFERCVRAGARTVIVAPYFLGPGKHWDRDIPALAAAAASHHPGVTFRVAEPIGLHPLMKQVIRSRIEQCLED